MAGFDVVSYSASRKYTEETVEGAGAIKGKNCVIDSIDDITGGHKVNFKWTLDDGTELEGSMEVMNGQDGVDGQDGAPGKDGDPGLGIKSVAINSNNHLIVTYDDDTTQDAGEIPSAGGTGDYEQLDNLPSIAGVQIIGNLTLAQLGINIPTSTSELTNDSGFITNAVNDLVNYYKKTETYTKEEVQQLIQAIPQMHVAIVQQLPTEDISTSTIYFVPRQTPDTNDVYDEYMYISNAWEHIGSTAIDLSNYYTKTQVDTLLAAKANAADVYTKSQVDTAISEVEDTVDSLSTAQSELADDMDSLSTSQSELAEDVETLGSEVAALAAKEHTGTYLAEVGTKEGSALAHTIYGMSVQDGTPTPDSPVEIQSAKADFRCVGKNLIPYPYHDGNSFTNNGITYTVNSDGSITANGTATANSYYNLILFDTQKVLKGNYILSKGSYDTTSIRLNLQIDSTTGLLYQSIDSAKSISLVDEHIFKIFVSVPSDSTLNNVTIHPMLTLEDADQTYEPYQHTDVTTDITLRAIEVTSSDDYNLERDGKYYVADTIDWSEDEGYQITRRIAEITLDGSEDEVINLWNNTTGSTQRRFAIKLPSFPKFITNASGIVERWQGIANYLQKAPSSSSMNYEFGYYGFQCITPDSDYRFSVYDYMTSPQFSSVTEFKTWLASNNIILDYILATPTTEPITSEQAQALLSLKTYDEATSISAIGDIEPSLDLEYSKGRNTALALIGHNLAHKNALKLNDINTALIELGGN